jgi:hypothetical protein
VPPPGRPPLTREERLAAALRENLRRRKAAQRRIAGRAVDEAAPPALEQPENQDEPKAGPERPAPE